METRILLNSVRQEGLSNEEQSLNLNLEQKSSSFPGTNLSKTINLFDEYVEERNACDKFRLSFNLKPYMTNVLYNMFTEVVYNEGLDGSITITDTPINVTDKKGLRDGGNTNKYALTRKDCINDTEYTHSDLGNLTYYCGIDIFNNHYLRSNGFFSCQQEVTNKPDENFNTISQKLIYGDGNIAKHRRESTGDEATGMTDERPTHMFDITNLDDAPTAIMKRLKEKDGWFGFYNPSYMNQSNLKEGSITINKCINNRQACEFIDLYPDRSLFYFNPKKNPNYENKLCYNWDWCLTYPDSKTYTLPNGDKFDFFDKEKGLAIIWNSSSQFLDEKGKNLLPQNSILTTERYTILRTKCRHNLNIGDTIRIQAAIGGRNIDFITRVEVLGNSKGESKEYYFKIPTSDLVDEVGRKKCTVGSSIDENGKKIIYEVDYTPIPQGLYVAKVLGGVQCDYYVRLFRKIDGLHSSLNKMGFAKTIYNDPISELLITDDIKLNDIRTDYGMPITGVYLTLVKTNKGHDKWYSKDNTTNPSEVEYSHCFGPISSGFNFEKQIDEDIDDILFADSNVRMIFNLPENMTEQEETLFKTRMHINAKRGEAIENNITVDNTDVFYGDFVEFNITNAEETVLENVYHRFNTAQREMKLTNETYVSDFSALSYTTLKYDDFSFTKEQNEATDESIANFTTEETSFNLHPLDENASAEVQSVKVLDNYFPEGYFYQPHYFVKLRDTRDIVKTGSDIKIGFSTTGFDADGSVWLSVVCPYALKTTDRVLVFYEDHSYKIYYVGVGSTLNKIYLRIPDGEIFSPDGIKSVFIRDEGIPDYAFYIADGSGRYRWREVCKDSEIPYDSSIYEMTYMNGAFYVNTNVDFYLRRQDALGIYGLKYPDDGTDNANSVTFGGNSMNIERSIYKTGIEYMSACKN